MKKQKNNIGFNKPSKQKGVISKPSTYRDDQKPTKKNRTTLDGFRKK